MATSFLLLVPDVRAGGMKDIGIATSADSFSLFHNPPKIAFSDKQVKFGIIYSPCLNNLTDIFLL